MLMTDPTTVVLEEQPFIVEIEQELGGLAGMAQADAAVLAAARARYFERVAAHTRLTPGMVIVDKQPLHTNQAAAIHRLFPEARFVLAMRHPCDAAVSCFLTNFRTNNAMSSFLDLGMPPASMTSPSRTGKGRLRCSTCLCGRWFTNGW
jgi:hypothetical protein